MQLFRQHVLLVTMGDKLLIYLRSGNPLKQIRGLLVDALALPPTPSPPFASQIFKLVLSRPASRASFLSKKKKRMSSRECVTL